MTDETIAIHYVQGPANYAVYRGDQRVLTGDGQWDGLGGEPMPQGFHTMRSSTLDMFRPGVTGRYRFPATLTRLRKGKG